MRLVASLLASSLLAVTAAAQTHIAPTEAKIPADERKAFKLPPGFEAQLVASEPDIGKPIQMAFDAKGRLWVTTSHHYPFPAEPGKASDKLYVLSDFGLDGKAKKVTVFADNLNIPIGILPLPDCNSCLVSSVGRVLKLTDTDGDGKADKTETILTGFGTKDTHGMTNSFTLLPDGWVYACHGYANASTVRGTDGSEIKMQSGNTYRFRPDGTHVEHWTFGQVNPFGMTVDPWLNLYTADCHTKPITQLIRGAYYDSFGKPHDGLGYAPHVTHHDHGSTALCGLAWYDADQFPAEYKGTMFLGNVVTNRINFDRIEWHGSTPVGKEQPDFLVSADPWFRPTDIKLGPDGALYVSDFYNRIIGHYEVDLHHPGRDKDRGRVWRIVWTGTDGKAKPPEMPLADWTKAPDRQLVHDLVSTNLTIRMIAANELARRLSGKSARKLDEVALFDAYKMFTEPKTGTTVLGLMMMVAEQVGKPQDFGKIDDEAVVQEALAQQTTYTGLTVRALGSRATWGDRERRIAFNFLDVFNFPRVKRAVVEAFIAHPHADNVKPLVELIQKCPKDDTHLRHAARIALRNALRDAPGAWAEAEKADPAVIADVALGVPSREAAAFLVKQLQAGRVNPPACERVGRYGDDAMAAAAVAVLKEKPAPVFAVQSLVRGLQARGGKLPPDTAAVAEAACARALERPNAFSVAAAAELAAELKLTALFDPFAKLAARSDRPESERGTAVSALMGIDPAKAAPLLGKTLTDAAAPAGVRERAAQALAGSNDPAAREALLAALSAVPARLAISIATGLASSPQGAAMLLDAVRHGKASARLLQEKGVAARLALHEGGKFKPQVEELTKGLPSADARLDGLIRARADGFKKARPNPDLGKKVFEKHCAACHQIGGQGAKVGPQLDGIGNRGAERILEDVLDPSRNVDAPFRATVLNLLDGRTLTGLLLREEGQVLVLADANGKEVRVQQTDIDKRTTSTLSPMPANFDTAIPEEDFYQLLAYLLEQRAKDPAGGR
jgi:putative heme-binding domain-containing protein